MRRIFILGILVIIVLMAGCNSSTQTGSSTPFIGGSNGIIESYIEGMPPEEIFDNGQLEFSIGTQIENVGETDIEQGAGYLKVEGILPEDFGLTSADLKKEVPALKGAKKNSDDTVNKGDIESVIFEGMKFKGSVPGTLQAGPVRVEACYDYETRAAAQLCIREKLTGEKAMQLCDPSGVKDVANSGAPIHITNLIEQPLQKGKIQITFQIESVGQENDRFYKVGTDCNNDLTNMDRYKVYVQVEDVSGVKPKCTGLENADSDSSGYKRLWNGKPQTVSCTLDFGNIDTSFKSIMQINLKYRYSQFIETGLLIKDVNYEEGSTTTTAPTTTLAATTTTVAATTTTVASTTTTHAAP